MPEEVVLGPSLDEIRQEWALKLNLLPEDIALDVLEKPGIFSRRWKVRLSWQDQTAPTSRLEVSEAIWDKSKYVFTLGKGVQRIIPYVPAGEVWLNGLLQDQPFRVSEGDLVEFQPMDEPGKLTWELQVRFYGLSVVAVVTHRRAGRYCLPKSLPALEELDLGQLAIWEDTPATGEVWDEAKLNADLDQLKVIHGRQQGIWPEILVVEGEQEVVVAVATPTVPTEHAQLEDFVGPTQVQQDAGAKSVDFYASKVPLVKEGAVLARKIPGKPGTPGQDVFGKIFPVGVVKDFQFRLKKNVHLSEDGLEVIATCDGQPVRLDEKVYMVENVYILHSDVDLSTGSIEFPGDVLIEGNVQDGLRVFAGGKIEIKGSVSHAEIRAEKGAKVHQSILGGKIIIGEKFVVRSELLRGLSDLRDQLGVCLRHTEELIKSPGAVNYKPGQCLKLVMEKQFPDLPKLSDRIEKFIVGHKNDPLITEGLVVAIRTAKHFLAGLGPLDLQSLPFLQRVTPVLIEYIENLSVEIPEKLNFVVSYVQGANIECGGSFECQKGVYNSEIRIEGDVKIEGVCRGGKIFAGGDVKIHELGGSGVSSTFVQISPTSRLLVDYCHPNAIIAVGKEITQIEEAFHKLEVYREKGRVIVEKVRVNPL